MIEIHNHEPKTGVMIVSIEGEVDMSSSPEVREALTPLFDRNLKALIINLAQVRYMDSSGIATMVEGLQNCTRKGIQFRLAELSAPVRDVFELARLTSIFKIFASNEEAVQGL